MFGALFFSASCNRSPHPRRPTPTNILSPFAKPSLRIPHLSFSKCRTRWTVAAAACGVLTPLGDLNTAGSSNAGRARCIKDSSPRYTSSLGDRSKRGARSASASRRQRLRSTAASIENSDPVGSAIALATVRVFCRLVRR